MKRSNSGILRTAQVPRSGGNGHKKGKQREAKLTYTTATYLFNDYCTVWAE